MAENEHAIGTPQWHAWGNGNTYARIHGNDADAPLSGEWAGDPTPADVIRQAWQDVMGPSWDTYTDGSDTDRDEDDSIVEAWEEGYFA